MSQRFKRVRDFLVGTAVRQFNMQYGRKIDPALCQVKSIRKNYGCKYGYEIHTVIGNDNLRLRFYFNLGPRDFFEPYRLETDEQFLQGQLGDEVYVMLGEVDSFYVESDLYRFIEIAEEQDVTADEYIQYMSGEFLHFMSGEMATYVEKP